MWLGGTVLIGAWLAFVSVAGDGCQDTSLPGSGTQSWMVAASTFPL